MATYRLYCMDGTGKIGLADWLEAEDDYDAVRQARKMKTDTLKCEVWQGTRLVRSLDTRQLSAR